MLVVVVVSAVVVTVVMAVVVAVAMVLLPALFVPIAVTVLRDGVAKEPGAPGGGECERADQQQRKKTEGSSTHGDP